MSSDDGWRPMVPGDLPRLMEIMAVVHATTPERPEVFAERLRLFPDGCFMAVDDHGYAVAHPALLIAPPPLDTLMGTLPAGADVLHIHDVAILANRRGGGLGAAVMRRMHDVAARARLARMTLISVYGSNTYWSRYGFTVLDPPPSPADLATYGHNALHMMRP